VGKKLKVSTASEWAKKTREAHTVRLPSGVVVRLRKPTFASLVRKNAIPSHLLSLAIRIQEGKFFGEKITPKDVKELVELQSVYAQEAVVEPKVVLQSPQNGEIALEDIPDEDLPTSSGSSRAWSKWVKKRRRWITKNFVEGKWHKILDMVARRYGKRPSEIVGIKDEAIAFDFDAAVAIRAEAKEEREYLRYEHADQSGYERLKLLLAKADATRH